MFAAYNAWKEKFKEEILDMGDKLNSGGRMVTASGVADGPFVEARELVGGSTLSRPAFGASNPNGSSSAAATGACSSCPGRLARRHWPRGRARPVTAYQRRPPWPFPSPEYVMLGLGISVHATPSQ